MERRARGDVMAGINVTPMADIMIVLLIIFMVMTPLIDKGHVRNLPLVTHSRERKQRPDTVVVSVTGTGATYLGDRPLGAPAELLAAVRALLAGATAADRVVYIKADEGLAYSVVQRVMDLCREAGAEEVALISRRRIGG